MGIVSWFKQLFAADSRPQPEVIVTATPEPIPVQVPPTPIIVPPVPTAQQSALDEPVKILVIDDSPTIIAVFRKILQPAGYQMIYAESAERGLSLVGAEKPDMIFLDIVLPGMNGFAALRVLRKDPLSRDIPVVMISGNEQAVEQFYAERIGADDFIKKPFRPQDVLVRITRLVPQHRLAASPAAAG